MSASENMVRKYMRELEAVELLSQRRRGLVKTNMYLLHDIRTSKIEVQEPHKSRTSKIEVQEPAQIAALEPQKLRGNNKQREQEIEINNSNIRKAHPLKNRRDENPALAKAPVTQASTQRPKNMASIIQGRRGRPTAAEAEARQVIGSYIEDFAREFNDQAPSSRPPPAPSTSTTPRAMTLAPSSAPYKRHAP